MSYQNPTHGLNSQGDRTEDGARLVRSADVPNRDADLDADAKGWEGDLAAQLCSDQACKGQRPHITHIGFGAPAPLTAAERKVLGMDVPAEIPDDTPTEYPGVYEVIRTVEEAEAEEADAERAARVAEFRRMDNARTDLAAVLRDAFTTEELAVLFDRLDYDNRAGSAPYDYPALTALVYAIGQAWDDDPDTDTMDPMMGTRTVNVERRNLQEAADLLAADDTNIGTVIYRLRAMAGWRQ